MDAETERDLLAGGEESPALEGPPGEAATQEQVEEEESMIDMQKVEGQVKASSIRKVEDIVESYPSETVSVLRSWMNQESS
jgi:flagellar M-ring protein FliF